ncbi:MAG TPA: DUF4331 domain-containing protein [Gaiellaceae bacterium]|jgi:hypothetical protein|nr:DUF4331 domain-containing protein [Gaiellaceae bacterium]
MRRIALALLVVLAVAAAVAVALVRGPAPEASRASSHREAPLISNDPAADNTDLYAFVSPDAPNTVTIIANYIPLEQPAGGPNFASFGDDVRYEIKVDNNGDGEEDVTYRFRFHTTTGNPNTFLYNTGPINTLSDADWNVRQTYSVTRISKNGSEVLGTNIPVPPVNIGPRSTPGYDALAAAAIASLPGGTKVFAGQRDDPFYVDLGSIFDLAGLRPFNSLHAIPLPDGAGVDGVGGYNTHSIVLQVPIKRLTRDHELHAADNPKAVIGVYATASRQKVRVLKDDGGVRNESDWVQISRLGEPLINEVVIPRGKKDLWNTKDPSDDAQFLRFYRSPEVTKLENGLYSALDNASESGRDDLVAILLTGVPGLNFTGSTKADLLRLNTGIAPTAAVGHGNRLGVLSGDLAGFPNGRRLEDDVVDIDLRAFAEGYGSFLHGLLGLPNRSPNNLLGDGVDANDRMFRADFPYIATPFSGYEAVPPTPMGGP